MFACGGALERPVRGWPLTSPSHSPEAVASPPCSKDLFDPATHAVDRLIPLVEPRIRFLIAARPNAGGDNAGTAAFCQHGITKMIAAVGAVGKHLTGIVRQGLGACLAVIDIGRSD